MIMIRAVACVSVVLTCALLVWSCGGSAHACGPGTTERAGECLAEVLSCPTGQVGWDGSCVDTSSLCGEGTVYLQETGSCLAAEGGVVGPLCGQNTSPDEEGRCVVVSYVTCGHGSELDANENECVPTSEICGDGSAFDSATGTCVATSEVCAEGTFFDEASRLCLPAQGCSPQDVVVDGFCLSPAQALAADAEVHANGQLSQPGLGGTPHSLPLTPGETTAFTGTIVSPTDLTGDGALNQHFDYFVFPADTGDWFEISVQSMGLPAPHFIVWLVYEEGDDTVVEYFRDSTSMTGNDKARQIRVPLDGFVLLQVGPEAALSGGTPPIIGGDDWDYVGSVTWLDPPTPAPHAFADGELSGMVGRLDQNYFLIDEFDPGALLDFALAENVSTVEKVVTIWGVDSEYHGEFEGSFSFEVPDGEAFTIVVDWLTVFANSDVSYTLTAQAQ
jgi:hypothetical protein